MKVFFIILYRKQLFEEEQRQRNNFFRPKINQNSRFLSEKHRQTVAKADAKYEEKSIHNVSPLSTAHEIELSVNEVNERVTSMISGRCDGVVLERSRIKTAEKTRKNERENKEDDCEENKEKGEEEEEEDRSACSSLSLFSQLSRINEDLDRRLQENDVDQTFSSFINTAEGDQEEDVDLSASFLKPSFVAHKVQSRRTTSTNQNESMLLKPTPALSPSKMETTLGSNYTVFENLYRDGERVQQHRTELDSVFYPPSLFQPRLESSPLKRNHCSVTYQ